MKLNYFKRPFVVLLTVPAFIALSIGLLPLIIVWAERQFAEGTLSPYVLQIGAESARTLLSVVAGGAMTALSLAYSLVLVVFTLAAGNIGPRLLKRFTSDLVNQITAGIFGGTFLFALLTILFVNDDFVPKVTITIAGALAVLSVFQLIYFVRHVSKSVTIDDEIAEITQRLSAALSEELSRGEASEDEQDDEAEPFDYEVAAHASGYVGMVDIEGLADIAREGDFVVRLEVPKGGYLIKGQKVFSTSKSLDDEEQEKCLGKIRIEPARSSDNEVEFSTNLLVEIGLRALSPGVNDTFTALAAVDSLSGALSEVVERNSMPAISTDDDGKVRVIQPSLSPGKLINDAFSPLRRASTNNILMAGGLARALGRLFIKCGDEAKDELINQAALLRRGLEQSGQFKDDIRKVGQFLPEELHRAFEKAGKKQPG